MDGYGPATYGDGFADVYDDWYAEIGDVAVATRTITEVAGGGRVLELGVGTGRLATPLAALGNEVWGLDASTAMLDRLAARPGGDAVHAVLGDMADPWPALEAAGAAPGDGFAVVVAAFNTFFLLASEPAQRSCLDAVCELVVPGGRLLVETYVPADPPADAETVLEPRAVELDRVVFTLSTHLPMGQVVHGQHVELREDGTRLRPWVLRYLHPEQLDGLAAAAGLTLLERWAGWDRRPFTGADRVHVSMYGGR